MGRRWAVGLPLAVGLAVCVGLEAPKGQCADGVLQVTARDGRFAGQFEVAGRWGGHPWYKGTGSAVIYFAGSKWIIGTTLGVRDLSNRRFAWREHPSLFESGMLWENQVSGRADPVIKVACGPPKPRVLEQDVAESIALFKTGNDRHLHQFLGVYRVTSQSAAGRPVYKLDQHGGFYLSFNEATQWIVGRESDVGTASGFAYLPLESEKPIEEVTVPTDGVWQIADSQHKWHPHADLMVARGTGGKVEVSGRVGTNEHINGVYQSYEQLCNHRFVYEKNNGEHVLYFMPKTQQWHISAKADVCTDSCWAYILPGTDVSIDDPEHAFGQWHVHGGGDASFAADPQVTLRRL